MPLNWIVDSGTGYARDLTGSWVLGSAWLEANPANITSGTLYPYVRNPRSYLCPADPAKTDAAYGKPLPLNRSYATQCSRHSMGFYFNGTIWPDPYLQFSNCVKLSSTQTPGPIQVWGFIEPGAASHDVASWNFFVTQLNVMWAHQPTDRHSSRCNLTFLDGHVEHYRWQAAHEWRGPGPLRIEPGGDQADYEHLLAGAPRAE
jgi:prepilin-type processing-associated H-X9-DG protein